MLCYEAGRLRRAGSLGSFSKKSSGEYIIEEKTGMVEAAKFFVEMTAIDQIEFVYEISRRD